MIMMAWNFIFGEREREREREKDHYKKVDNTK